jgi:hypothetical protein
MAGRVFFSVSMSLDGFIAPQSPEDLMGQLWILGSRLGVQDVPAFFINGRYLAGTQSIESFRKVIDEELARAKAALKRGVKPAEYYHKEVVKLGKPSVD